MSQYLNERNPMGRQRFPLAVLAWLLVLSLGIFCVWWGFFGPGSSEGEPTPTETPPVPADQAVLPTETESPPLPQATTSLDDEVFGYGIQVHGVVGDPAYTMGQVQSLGLGWVKQQVRWHDFELAPGEMDWSGFDAVVDEANRHGLRVMLSVVDAPTWSRPSFFDDTPEGAPPEDLSLTADFLGRLVDRYQGRIHAIEVWNEQNLAREWDTAEGVNPEQYVEMLRLSYQAIKSRDPNIIVISGALSPVGFTGTDANNPSRITVINDREYLQAMVANGLLSYCDCVGTHHNGYNIPPDIRWDDPYQDDSAIFRGFWDNPDISWTFRSTIEYYNDTVSGMKPLCLTEFGWATAEGQGGFPPGFEFAQDNTLQEQSDFIVQGYQLMREWGFVRLAFLWNLDFAQKGGANPQDPNAPYSILSFTGAARPAYGAIGAMEKP